VTSLLGRLLPLFSEQRRVEEAGPFVVEENPRETLARRQAKTPPQTWVYSERLFSAYDTPAERVWVMTDERDRSATTILLPEEY
jgi:hypothetical protein